MKHGKILKFKANSGHFSLVQQQAKKKMAKISVPQLRVMFPQYMHLADVELVNQLKRDGRL